MTLKLKWTTDPSYPVDYRARIGPLVFTANDRGWRVGHGFRLQAAGPSWVDNAKAAEAHLVEIFPAWVDQRRKNLDAVIAEFEAAFPSAA